MKIHAIVLIILLVACAQPSEEIQSNNPDQINTPEAPETLTPSHAPTNDLQVFIDQAVVINENFEDQEYYSISDWKNEWDLETFNNGNSVICNSITNAWGLITFGDYDYENYVVQADIYFMEASVNPGFEIYIRYGVNGDGYRATLINNQWAGLNWYGPYIDFGGKEFSIRENEQHTFRVEALDTTIKYFIDEKLITEYDDSHGLQGKAGIGTNPGTKICVDNIKLWFIDENGPIARENLEGFSDPDDPLSKYEGDCVFCFVNNANEKMPIKTSTGWTYQSDDQREVIILDETFTVNINDEVVFEDKIIIVRPNSRRNIQIFGNLIIRDSLVLWDQNQHKQSRLQIMDGGRLEIYSSYAFGMNNFWVMWEYEDGATVLLDNFIGDPWTTIRGSVNYSAVNYSTVRLTLLFFTANSNVLIENAHHVHLEIFPPPGSHTIKLPRLKQWADWEISNIWDQTLFQINNSYVFNIDVSIENDTHVTVIDTPEGFKFGWVIHKDSPGWVECEIRNLGDPNNDGGVFYEDHTWDLLCNNSSLTVINSRLKRAWPTVWGNVNLRVYNSNLIDPTNYGGAKYEIYNSSIDHVFSYGQGLIYIENCSIKWDAEIKDPGSIIYYYNENQGETAFSVYEIDGGKMIFLENPGVPWK